MSDREAGDEARAPDRLRTPWPGPLRKARVVLLGLWRASHDFNVAYKMVASVVVLALTAATRQWIGLELVAVATGLLLTSELFNTAVEKICDFVESAEDERIAAIKDIAAAAAGLGMVVWVGVLALEVARLVYRLT
jgi:diacylglycerol kinase